MPDGSALPPSLAPRFLSREQAAEYVGVSPNLFDAEVEQGMWPPAVRRGAKAGRVTWDRLALDAAASRISGLATPALAGQDAPSPGWTKPIRVPAPRAAAARP